MLVVEERSTLPASDPLNLATPATAFPSESNPDANVRIHYIDNLRALAMVMGVLLHAGLAYAAPSQSFWIATDPQSSAIVDAGIWFIHLFRMALFFLISGYFAKHISAKKGTAVFLKNRAIRILLPFVIFYPFLLVAMAITVIFGLSYLQQPKGLLGLIAAASQNPTATTESTPWSTIHLWFLYYLAIFSLAAVLIQRISILNLDWLAQRPKWIVVTPMILLPAVFWAGTPLPAPESFAPQWWAILFYGYFFAGGWNLWGRETWIERCSISTSVMLTFAIIAYIPYYCWLPVMELNELEGIALANRQGVSWRTLAESFLTAYLSVALVAMSLILGRRYLNRKNDFLRFISDASYWVYLIHLPLVIFLQMLIIPCSGPYWIKFPIVILGTLIPCLATYVVFVRYTPLGWMLHGRRSFP